MTNDRPMAMQNVELRDDQTEEVRRYAAYLNITFDQAVNLLFEAGMKAVVEEIGAGSVEDADPGEIARYILEETEGYDD